MQHQNQTLKFSLNIPQSKILRYYEGHVKNLIVTLDNGKRVQLPLINFRPFISDEGLQGLFEVTFTSEFKLVSLNRINH